MVKAADAAASDGWRVIVVASSSLPWQRGFDVSLARSRPWALRAVEWSAGNAPMRSRWYRGRLKAARGLTTWLGERTPWTVVMRAAACPVVELTQLAVQTRADLFYGGGGGGAVIASAAAERLSVPFAVDFEDFHSGEYAEGDPAADLWRRIEDRLLARADLVTAGSDAIADVYRARGHRDVIAIHNVVPLPSRAPCLTPRERLRFYWFGQTIGPGRGLEECLDAMATAGVRASVTLRGVVAPEYLASLRERAASASAGPEIEHVPFAPPGQMLETCDGFDVGLAFELGRSANNARALSNKALTYLAAGLAPLLSRTAGTATLLGHLGDEALTAAPDAAGELADVIGGLSDRARLARARARAWQAANERWHWEHVEERGRLLAALREVA
jgi:hypothetical protein